MSKENVSGAESSKGSPGSPVGPVGVRCWGPITGSGTGCDRVPRWSHVLFAAYHKARPSRAINEDIYYYYYLNGDDHRGSLRPQRMEVESRHTSNSASASLLMLCCPLLPSSSHLLCPPTTSTTTNHTQALEAQWQQAWMLIAHTEDRGKEQGTSNDADTPLLVPCLPSPPHPLSIRPCTLRNEQQ